MNIPRTKADNLLGALPRIKTLLNLRPHFEVVKPGLDYVDKVIRQQADSFDPGIAGYIEYATESSGKRIRPALMLLCAHATGGVRPAHYDLSVIIEMIHLASLIHDDILDNAVVRRAKPTVFTKWGTELSVLLGDSLFAHSLGMCARVADRETNVKVADAAHEVCTGEILQMQRRFDIKLTLNDYLRIISMKTAALFRISCELAPTINEKPAAWSEAFKTYGESLGVAYQIYDDCLDLYGTEESTGKTLGTDLRKGKFTLPLIHLLQQLNESELAEVSSVIVSGDNAAQMKLLQRIIDQGGIKSSIRRANDLLEKAERSLDVVDNNEFVEALRLIPRAVAQHLATLQS